MDFVEQRERAQEAWEFALGHLVSKGCDEAVALETMAEVALRTYADRQGAAAAASYLRSLAQQVEDDECRFAAALMRG
ncbi:hypothetical protein [Methylobacterium nodulans]|uniref:Uncharacterized protein n=1 Tax=Methylobacterium nodulans (strain LMG 21967 / CNCM I-2342 / ORS 2060) TaxID=460265 RepID=B8IBE3_METNO|nr:hypothetical protein [Methylobacterium nodulans]ACL57358.1 conserved hypothetical protein [Methylobacterium nodulans ORS 2060]